jgi:hypothetical protein
VVAAVVVPVVVVVVVPVAAVAATVAATTHNESQILVIEDTQRLLGQGQGPAHVLPPLGVVPGSVLAIYSSLAQASHRLLTTDLSEYCIHILFRTSQNALRILMVCLNHPAAYRASLTLQVDIA